MHAMKIDSSENLILSQSNFHDMAPLYNHLDDCVIERVSVIEKSLAIYHKAVTRYDDVTNQW